MLGRAFMELGFEKKTYRNVRGYVVVRRTVDEMRVMRQTAALTDHSDNTNHTDDTDIF